MTDYPSNSHKEREGPPPKQEPKKIQPVVSGEVHRRRKPIGKRFVELFGGRQVFSGAALDVLLPSARDTAVDYFNTIIDRIFYPNEMRTGYRRGASRYSGSSNYTNYQRYSSGTSIRGNPRDDRRPIPERTRAITSYEEVILETRHEADEVLERMYDLLSQYERVSIADLNQLVGVTGPFTDQNWGWTSLHGSRVTRIRSGYLLDLPKPEPLER